MITYRLLGRNGLLGNQLWQIASTVGIARSQGTSPAFPYWRYGEYFSVPDEYFPDLTDVKGDDLGWDWLQDVRHFASIETHIRDIFRPSLQTWERLARRHRTLLDLPHKTALHVRRGDYLTPENREFHVQLSPEYYEAAMTITDPPYLIFSDDISWCRRRFRSDCIFVEHNRDYEDLLLMSTCDAVITANSSFSWWGAWLSGGRRIYARRWHLPAHVNSPVRGTVQESHMRPVGAEILDN